MALDMEGTTTTRRTLTMDWDALGEVEDDDHFFETYDRMSSAFPQDLAASGSDDDDEYEDGRMSFASAVSSASYYKPVQFVESAIPNPSILGSYDMWMADPGDVKERRKKLLQGMGLSSKKDLLKQASAKIVKAMSKKHEPDQALTPPPTKESKVTKVEPEPNQKPKPKPKPEPGPVPVHVPVPELSASTPVVLVRSRSDSDIDMYSAKTKQRKEELIGSMSKQRLIRTLSGKLIPSIGVCRYTNITTISSVRAKRRPSMAINDAVQSDDGLGSFFLIKNLDSGKEFIVKESNEEGMWNKVSDIQTGKQLSLEEFEKSVGYSPVVKELMGRRHESRNLPEDGRKAIHNSSFSKSFRNSKRKGAAFLKNMISGKIIEKEQENSSLIKAGKDTTSQWVKARQNGKSYKELTALHMSQEIQAHEGSIWTMRFSSDARYLASAGEDRMIHVWEVQECDVMSVRSADDFGSACGTPVHPMAACGTPVHPMAACGTPVHPMVAGLSESPSQKRKKRKDRKKGNLIPDYVNVPETVFALSEKPVCTFMGHQEDVLDLSWSKSQHLLSSSMDKTVRMWDLETKGCLKIFKHNDYVTCIHFNPVDDDYFISGSLDAKVRIWNVPDRQVVDWIDIHEMVTAACYTPDGQGAVIGSHQGACRMYKIDDCKLEPHTDIQKKKKPQPKKIPVFQPKSVHSQSEKITGIQFSPSTPSEMLITSASSRIRLYTGSHLAQKFKGVKNINSQIQASFSPDGKHVISPSEDSHVFLWKVDESKNSANGKVRSRIKVQANEHFHCKDVAVAIPWPGSVRTEPPIVELHSKRHSKRSTSPLEDNLIGATSRRHLPPLPKIKNGLERSTSGVDEDFNHSPHKDPGIGISESFNSSSHSMRYGDSPSISASGAPPLHSRSLIESIGHSSHHAHIIQATSWGMVIVTGSLEGEIRVYQNFGLPVKVGGPANLFRTISQD